ncbi:MAG: GGDEF domain-containing protein, partial [Lachnospiraceae bacterium]|nr:GGDEF domain-containing protein [Lachnospiraceae bacterium]
LKYEPTFYIGDRATIIKNELMSSIMNLVVVFVMFFVGVIVIAYSVFSARNRTNSYSLVYLGVFAVMLAMWFFINMPVINMVFDLGTIFTYMSYIILGSITVPLILFEKRLMEDKYSRACDALCMFNVVAQLIIYGLQLFGIKDMKETLIVTHVAIGVSAVVLVTLLVIDFITVGWKNLNGICKLNMLCGLLTAVGVGFDIVYYYININSGRNYLFTKIFFLIHVVSLCCYSMNETRKLMSKGKEAQKYEKLAYRDELTGVFNRTACNNDMKKMDLTEDKYTVIMFDLNNLKKCNDTLGHNFGDDYIISSARYIKESFEGVGKCYRIGGDEFSVIGKNTSDEVIELCYKEMQKRIDEYNSINKEINMSIAFGYAVYDPEVDEDLKDTRGRADGLMYKNKMNMKEKIN